MFTTTEDGKVSKAMIFKTKALQATLTLFYYKVISRVVQGAVLGL
jgi:hypothetical protein